MKMKIVWILNLSPDSFSDWRWFLKKQLKERLQYLIDSWADIIDIWAESTAPWSKAILLEEEMLRLELFFDIISNFQFQVSSFQFSLDTMKSEIAKKGIEMWVSMINDVSWGRFDEKMFKLIARTWVKYVLMYCANNNCRARLGNQSPWFDKKWKRKILALIIDFFKERIEVAKKAWIKDSQLILDPWMWAFISDDYLDSIEVLKWIWELKKKFNLPIYIWTSRKGFLWKISKDSGPKDRLWSSLASAYFVSEKWVDFIRVHDVKEHRQFFDVLSNLW